MHIVMLTAENDCLPGGKVGGIGDVLRDVPLALAAQGHRVSIIMPAYGALHQLENTRKLTLVQSSFEGQSEQLEVYQPASPATGVELFLLEHPLFSLGGVGKIYCDDPADSPFASDARKFALFCRASAALLLSDLVDSPDVIHMHDWHTAFLAVLCRFDPQCRELEKSHLVYSIHNLAIQGIRPLQGAVSSLASWYPDLDISSSVVNDPRWPNCINPMAAAIRLSDAVHTVSPSYAEDIVKPSRIETDGFYGGEGLQSELQQAKTENRLFGILNGCDYDIDHQQPLQWPALLDSIHQHVNDWISESQVLLSADYQADQRLQRWQSEQRSGSQTPADSPQHIITSIGRLTEQKVRLYTCELDSGKNTLEHLLDELGERGIFIMIGSGDPDYETFFTRMAAVHNNFLFLNHYAERLSRQLYASGDLFLMPSSFEPCGISQMLAMREGQPCLVHAVGGLKDTVSHRANGFTFSADTFTEQAQKFVQTFSEILDFREKEPERWQSICDNAAQSRFLWSDSVENYLSQLYAK